MVGPLEGRVAVVTGGSRGIGAAVAMRLATDGATVAVTHPGSDGAEEVLAASGRAGISAARWKPITPTPPRCEPRSNR